MYDVLQMANISRQFADQLLPEFILYWQENGTPQCSWSTKFLQYVKRQWARHNQPLSQRVPQMANSKDLIQKVASGIAASSTQSPTAAGHPKATPADPQLIDAINQIFAFFRINYHNQYYSAFGDNTKSENLAKKLWLSKLSDFSAETIIAGAEKVIAESDYLPTCIKCSMPAAMRACLRACHRRARPIRKSAISRAPKPNSSGLTRRVYALAANVAGTFLPIPLSQKRLPLCRNLSAVLRAGCGWRRISVENPEALPETSLKPATKKQALASG